MPNIALDSTPQQVADFVVAHLYKQGKPAKNGNTCAYRVYTEEGVLSCAVGCLLTEDELIEGKNQSVFPALLQAMRREGKLEAIAFYEGHQALLTHLQIEHDDWSPKVTVDRLFGETLEYNFGALIPALKVVYLNFHLSLPPILQTE